MLKSALVAEAVGVFGLCFIGGGSIYVNAHLGDAGPGLLGIALAHGIILGIAVTAAMNVSGGHINPAVTFAMLITGRIGFGRAIAYVVAQLVGGIVAGFLLSGVIFANVTGPSQTGATPVVDTTHAATPVYDVRVLGVTDDYSVERGSLNLRTDATQAALRAVLIEAVLTFFLVFAVFGTAVDPRHPNVGGFGVGLAVAVDILAGGPLTGGAMNPARFVGTGLIWAGPIFWEQLWVYWVGPLAGAAVAALLYQHLILDKSASPRT